LRIRIFLVALLLLTTALLGGCSSTGPIYQTHRPIAHGTSQIVIYRGDEFFQGGIPYLVKLDGKAVAVLRNGGYSVIAAAPGTSTIEIRAARWDQWLFHNPLIAVSMSANERLFVRATPELGNTVSLRVVPATIATQELQSLKESQQ